MKTTADMWLVEETFASILKYRNQRYDYFDVSM